MPDLTRKNWPLGWLPSDDKVNGRKDGLARMDNLQLDEHGIISLTRGIDTINTNAFPGFVHTIFSNAIGSYKDRYVALSNGEVWRSSGDFASNTILGTGGHPTHAAFGKMLGQVFIGDGSIKKKDDGNVTYDWGIAKPNAPTATAFGSVDRLTGAFEYRLQYVYNSGSALHKSPLSESSASVEVTDQSIRVTFTAPTDPQVNEIWIFRRSVVTDNFPTAELEQFYRVGVVDYQTLQYVDELLNTDALELNIVGNLDLIAAFEIPDDIIGIEGNYFERLLAMTFKEIYLSDRLNPDAFKRSEIIKLSGNTMEVNLWIAKVAPSTLLIGTSHDIYELSGTLLDNPDGSIDVLIRSMGIKHPPIGRDYAVDSGITYYMASDGVRSISPSAESKLISEQLSLLFQGETRYGITGVAIHPLGLADYPITIARGKLWVSVPNKDGTRYTYVLDYLNDSAGRPNYWYTYFTDPISLCVEEDDILIAGYGGGSGNYLRQLDIGNTIDGVGQAFRLETFFDDHNLPRNRKDTFTFKISADSGGQDFEVLIGKNGNTSSFVSLGSINFAGKGEKLITIAETVGFGKSFSVAIKSDNINLFKLYNWTIEYEPRPEQLTYLRIPYTNLGTPSRKRVVNYAFVIDTMGETCEFFPMIDGVLQTSSTFTLDYKGTYIHYFDADTVGTDFGGIICGFFEFYGINLDEIHSEKMPVPCRYLVIPQTDYGSPNRKRHSSYKFIINTRGQDVVFTPRIDGTNHAPKIFNTSEKQVVEYFFMSDTIGINIGGTLNASTTTPFEFYGVITPQQIELLPPRLTEFRIPENNYGVPAKKRIRTMPMEINTNGEDVVFTPIVDNIRQTSSTLNTLTRQTVFHYFTTDIFGIDYSGELLSAGGDAGPTPFEFYGLMKPVEVEVLPTPKKFDQIGPLVLERLGKFIGFRVRLIATGASLPFVMYAEDTAIHSGVIQTTPNIDKLYEVEYIPKSKYGTVIRLELGPSENAFHRFFVTFKVNMGMTQESTEVKWIRADSYKKVI